VFVSGVPSCLRTDDPRLRSFTSTAESRHPKTAPYGLAALVVAALIAATGVQSMIEAPSASADANATVEAQTERMSDADLTSTQDGSYNPGDQLTLVCSTRGQNVNGFFSSDIPGGWDDLWYRTSDGHFVADADIATATLNIAAPECSPPPPSGGSGAAQAAHTDRATGRTQGSNPGTAMFSSRPAVRIRRFVATRWRGGTRQSLRAGPSSTTLRTVRSSCSNPVLAVRAQSATSRGWIRSPNVPMADGST